MATKIRLIPLDRNTVSPREVSPRLRGQLVYFAAPAGATGIPALGEAEYWFRSEEVSQWLEDGVFYLVSPLDTANQTELELTEEQEALLLWLQRESIQHVRVLES
jgi:hypothetical protein